MTKSTRLKVGALALTINVIAIVLLGMIDWKAPLAALLLLFASEMSEALEKDEEDDEG